MSKSEEIEFGPGHPDYDELEDDFWGTKPFSADYCIPYWIGSDLPREDAAFGE